ncbi:MAG: MFS transporter [Raineya sp.]|jgi:MHS family proline/betaine transporter-like MFS transporter|nr:MFS transporter [Raineya sp.]
MASSSQTTHTQTDKNIWGVITASSVGTLIEWYDFYIFGSLAAMGIIGKQFFPGDNPTAAFLSSLATFAAGFIVRPFGALFFGRLGDLIGRKYTFLVTLLLMGGSTFFIGLIPSYASWGAAAPALVLLLRLLQGLALGGEYGGAATYVAEHAGSNKRGYFTAYIQTTATLGLLMSIGVIILTQLVLRDDKSVNPNAAFEEWGWRIPFLVSIFLIVVSVIIRMKMHESPMFKKVKAEGKTSKNPLKESFANKANLKMVLLSLFGATAGQGVVWYTGQYYALSFMNKTCGIDSAQANEIIMIAIVFVTPFFLVFGALSDRIGRKYIMMAGLLAAMLAYRPIYQKMFDISDLKQKDELVDQTKTTTQAELVKGKKDSLVTTKITKAFEDGTTATLITKVTKFEDTTKKPKEEKSKAVKLSGNDKMMMTFLIFIQIFFVTMVYGPIAAFLVEIFPTKIRYTSMSLPYHIGNGIFGGLTPYIVTRVIEATKTTENPSGDILAGLWYPIGIAALTFIIGMIYLPSRTDKDVMD